MPGLVTILCICSRIGVHGASPSHFVGLATPGSADERMLRHRIVIRQSVYPATCDDERTGVVFRGKGAGYAQYVHAGW